MELVNLFNSLYVSSCRIVQRKGHYHVYHRNVVSTFIGPLVICGITGFCGGTITLERLHFFLQSTAELSSLARYVSLTAIVVFLTVWCLVQRRKILKLLESLISYDRHSCRLINGRQPAIKLRLAKTGITFICLTYAVLLGIRAFMCLTYYLEFGPHTTILLFGAGLLELYFYLHQLFMQHFAEQFSERYRLLRRQLRPSSVRTLVRSVKLYDRLVLMQEIFADTFGVQLLLSTLLTFLDCAIITYHSFHMLGMGVSAITVAIESVFLIPRVLLFFGLTYQFERLSFEEQEFKNAIKSLQYEATEEHSEDYLNFLDLINLKLMTESPKITACGLFTVNLQVFYNVFAAIVTYIMILFQFRDFEK
ncbi:uncharacterized protein LOC120418926 isoform X2 [Culex pipiens pallens]|uniref:uncharacterized protein LOC120418926 isoform X2 n=1 Tax=Culex pipiens pallens TaxID=42434 RepID=UPI001952F18D|nr:uncharacterized protein LOC120418926 isoform X2 [Culex pipiens pallens]